MSAERGELRSGGPGESLRLGVLGLGAPEGGEWAQVLGSFADELHTYAELVTDVPGALFGVTTRGEGPDFRERVARVIDALGLGAEASAAHLGLARWFDDRRAFVKLEWVRRDSGWEPSVSCYFRRRPSVEEAVRGLASFGVPGDVLERVCALAAVLGKESVHFVAAGLRRDAPPTWKVYFSQLVTAQTLPERLGAALDLWNLDGRWLVPLLATLPLSSATLPGVPLSSATLFVSASASGSTLSPTLKLDLPGAGPLDLARWGAPDGEVAVRRLCRLTGRSALSFVGVRLSPGGAAPGLKLYADLSEAP